MKSKSFIYFSLIIVSHKHYLHGKSEHTHTKTAATTNENATAEQLLLTVQMLYAELLFANQKQSQLNSGKVFVMMPAVLSAINENGQNIIK